MHRSSLRSSVIFNERTVHGLCLNSSSCSKNTPQTSKLFSKISPFEVTNLPFRLPWPHWQLADRINSGNFMTSFLKITIVSMTKKFRRSLPNSAWIKQNLQNTGKIPLRQPGYGRITKKGSAWESEERQRFS